MKLDSAVVSILGLDSAEASVTSHGGGCSSASTSKVSTVLKDGTEREYFMKTGKGEDAAIMFEGEHASLSAIHNAVPNLCPKSHGYGHFVESPKTHFLVTDFMDLAPRLSGGVKCGSSTGESLATKMARLHSTPAPPPPGKDAPMFGFPCTTCCGDTPQDNSYKYSWADFYAENRLRFILARSEKSNGADKELRTLVETTADIVVPRLIGDEHLNNGKGVTPVVVHGDLWAGNASRGLLPGMHAPEDIIFDSSACYAHNEYEFGIMKMFGGFGSAFFKEYHAKVPKTEPASEYDDRVKLYELYHHLNHHAMFGGGYRSGAVSIMKDLIRKYGKQVKTEL